MISLWQLRLLILVMVYLFVDGNRHASVPLPSTHLVLETNTSSGTVAVKGTSALLRGVAAGYGVVAQQHSGVMDWPYYYWILIILLVLFCSGGLGAISAAVVAHFRKAKMWATGEPEVSGIEDEKEASPTSTGGFLGPIIKSALESAKAGNVIGVPVKVGAIEGNAMKGIIKVHGLLVGNPEGYWNGFMLQAKEVVIDIDMQKLIFSRGKHIDLEELTFRGVELVFERSVTRSNIRDLIDNLKKNTKSKEPEPNKEEETGPHTKKGWWHKIWHKDPEAEANKRRVTLHKVEVKDIGVLLASYMLMGIGPRLQAADIIYEDFDKQATKEQLVLGVVPLLLATVLKSTLATVVGKPLADEVVGEMGNIGDKLGKGANQAFQGAVDGANQAVADAKAAQAKALADATKAAHAVAGQANQASDAVKGAGNAAAAASTAATDAVAAGAGQAQAHAQHHAAGISDTFHSVTDKLAQSLHLNAKKKVTFADEDGHLCEFQIINQELSANIGGKPFEGTWTYDATKGCIKGDGKVKLVIAVPEGNRKEMQNLMAQVGR